MRHRLPLLTLALTSGLAVAISSCNRPEPVAHAAPQMKLTVGVYPVERHSLGQQLTISSELVPFQEIEVFAKEAGYVKQLLVDFGTHVHKGQLMAVLEIPELEAQLQQRQAAIRAQQDEVARAKNDIGRVKAQHDVLHLEYERLASVAKANPGLVAAQEVDDSHGKDLAAESQLESAQGMYQAAVNQLAVTKAQLAQDQALYDYARITAPFDGVVTQRYANLGALMQAGTSSTQSTPLVRLSQENLFRLVIPVPESYVRYIHVGEPVEVRVPSLGRSFPGKVARSSVDVNSATRTMHTEVDVPNTDSRLVPGLYAEAVITPDSAPNALVLPVQAVDHNASGTTVDVVSSDQRVEVRNIALGVQNANYVEVKSGVSEGEPVIVSERGSLKPGEEVKTQKVPPMTFESSIQDQ